MLQPEYQPDREFADLVQRVLNREASLADIAILNARLPCDPVALRYFVEMRMLHGALEDRFRSTHNGLTLIDGRLVQFPGNPIPSQAPPTETTKLRRRKILSGAAALITLTLGLVATDRILHRPTFEVVAHHGTGLSEVPAKGTWIRRGDSLKLGYGAVEMRSPDGNSLTLQGPGEIRIKSRERIVLDSGLLWADLDGEPVRIQVPRGEITDLGTTFGIDQSSPSATRIDVFDGGVRFNKPEDSANAVEATKGESLVSSGTEWTPERGEADAARYTTGIRRPVGFTFVAGRKEADRITSALPFGIRWTTANTPSGALKIPETPVTITWAGSSLYFAGAAESPEGAVFHTHLKGRRWSGKNHVRTEEAAALGLPVTDGGIVIQLANLSSWLEGMGAKACRIAIYRNSEAEDTRFQPVSIYRAHPSDDTYLFTIVAKRSDYKAAEYPDGSGGTGARAIQEPDFTFTEDRFLLTMPTQNGEEDPNRGNISGLVLHPVF